MDWILTQLGIDPIVLTSPIIAAGKIAFLGVVVGLLGNVVVLRVDRWAKRSHERRVMRSALLAELSFLVKSYEVRAKMMEEAETPFDVPTHTATEVYDRLLDKIGLLTVDQAGKVIHAYLAAKQMPMNLRRMARNAEVTDQLRDTEDFIRVARSDMAIGVRLHRERIVLFKDAIVALGG
jgi:hypothetical protein